MLKVNKKKLKPYGDRLEDGAMQLSFTLPVDATPEAREAAKHYVEKLGLKDVAVSAMEPMGKGFTSFVVYGHAKHTIDITKIKVPRVEFPVMHYEELKDYMERNLDRAIVVVGATTGSDAHTVGIDAIMNMKGYSHDFGLERYPLFKAVNLRSQLSNQKLIDKAVELEADVILISQVVTQRESHIKNLKEFRDLWKRDKRLSKNVMVIIGGPRLDHAHALKLGFNAGFGPGTKPSQVGAFIVHEYMKHHHLKEKPPREAAAAKKEHHKQKRHVHSVPERAEHRERAAKGHHHAAKDSGHAPRKKKKTRRGKRGGRRRNKKRTDEKR